MIKRPDSMIKRPDSVIKRPDSSYETGGPKYVYRTSIGEAVLDAGRWTARPLRER